MNLALAAVSGIVFVFGVLRWRQAVLGAMVFAVFEGALRKWVFPEEQQWVYFVKDLLLLGAYVGFFGRRMLGKVALLERHPANGPLIALAVVAILQITNPALPSLELGLFGIRAYLIYAPLLYLVPAVFPDAARARRFWTYYLALSLLPLALGPVQFAAPPDSELNRYAWTDELAPGVAEFVGRDAPRVTGTFSYISGYTAYLVLLVLVGLALAVGARRGWLRWSVCGVVALALTNLLMTGSRGPFIVLALAVPALLALQLRMGVARFRQVAVLAVGVPLAALLVGSAFPEGYRAFLERARESGDASDRMVGIVREPLWAVGEAGLLGFGVGSTHQARAYLDSGTEGVEPPAAEGEWERIVLELGPVGFALVILTRLLVSWRLWTALRGARGTSLLPLLGAALLFSLASIPGSLIFNHTAHLFYWFLAGHALIPARAGMARVSVAQADAPAAPRVVAGGWMARGR